MRKFFYICMLTLFSIPLFAQYNYAVDSIAPRLRAGAKAVVRSRQVKIEVLNLKKSELEFKEVVTLLNDRADDYRIFEIPYDQSSRVGNIRASAYDENGKLIWNLQPFNVMDMRDSEGPEFLSDDREKVFEVPAFNYPFTISYSFTISESESWVRSSNWLQSDPEEAVEESGIQYIVPRGMEFNSKILNLRHPTDIVHEKQATIYTWREDNLPAIRQRDFAPLEIKKIPVVYATPLAFSRHGYPGSFESWKTYGQWINTLNTGRDELDPVYVEKAREIVKGIRDPKEKIRKLYAYMQSHTRYFSISFGIGGNQPIPANEVAEKGYGDCKALSNYMKVLLKAVGIPSYYTLVKAGPLQYMQPDFPSDQFNHAILCVPNNGDTVWLECTNQTMPFNYLGSFTCDRDVLLITPEGGKIARTPRYGADFNRSKSIANIELAGSGDVEVDLRLERQGLLYDGLYGVSQAKKSEQHDWLSELLDNKGLEVQSDSFLTDSKAQAPSITARFTFKTRNYASRSSNRLFVAPALITGMSYLQEDPGDISVKMGYSITDCSRIELPIGYTVEYMPENKSYTSKFGHYSRTISQDRKYLYFSRTYEIQQSDYPGDIYDDFQRFINEMASDDREMAILKSK